jgi:hypothetical protein
MAALFTCGAQRRYIEVGVGFPRKPCPSARKAKRPKGRDARCDEFRHSQRLRELSRVPIFVVQNPALQNCAKSECGRLPDKKTRHLQGALRVSEGPEPRRSMCGRLPDKKTRHLQGALRVSEGPEPRRSMFSMRRLTLSMRSWTRCEPALTGGQYAGKRGHQ